MKLGEACPNIQSGKDQKEEGKIPLYGASKQLAYTRSASYSPPLILIGRVGESVGKLQWINIPCGVSDNALVIQGKELLKNTDMRYLLYCLTNSPFERYAGGSGQKVLAASHLKNIFIALPTLAEQKKIAGLLSLIDERIEVQNAIIKEREAQKASLLRRLFDRTLRFPEFTDEWKEVKLGEVAEIIGGGTPSTTTTNYWDGEIVWFNPSEIGKKKYVSNSNRTISFQGLSNSGARLLPKGTVLLTTRATIGEIAIANVECTTNQGFQSVVTGHEANNEYVYYFLSTQKVYLLRHSSGSTFLETPSSVIRNLPLRLPSLAEQRKIAALLLAVDERITVEKEYATLLQKQKAYLLRQMFI